MAYFVDVWRVAQDFGCSDRQIQIYARQGMPRAGLGKYDLKPCRKWLQSRNSQRPGSITKQILTVRANRAVLSEVRRVLQSLPGRIAPKLCGRHKARITRILRNAIDELIKTLPSEITEVTGSQQNS
jgi:hypothetical protein